MSRKILFVGLIIFSGLILAAVAGQILAQRWLRVRLEEAVNSSCMGCELRIGSLSLRPYGILIEGVQFKAGDPRDSEFNLVADLARIPIPLSNLQQGPWRVGLVELEGVEVMVHEGDAHFPASEKGNGGLGFEVAGLTLAGAKFTYRKDSTAGSGFIRMHEISAGTDAFGSSAALKDLPLHGHAEARLEKSGEVKLSVEAKFFSSAPHADIDLKLNGQNLGELNSYFRTEEGVDIHGKLIGAHGIVSLRDARAEGNVEVSYEGLELKFHANRHRGALSALLQNLGAKLKVKGGNSLEPRREREQGVVTRRHSRESVVSFILRTLREAALRVASS